jgi:hypothetical protein
MPIAIQKLPILCRPLLSNPLSIMVIALKKRSLVSLSLSLSLSLYLSLSLCLCLSICLSVCLGHTKPVCLDGSSFCTTEQLLLAQIAEQSLFFVGFTYGVSRDYPDTRFRHGESSDGFSVGLVAPIKIRFDDDERSVSEISRVAWFL